MEIRFQKYSGSSVAYNPRIERRAEQLIMKFEEEACSHFLIFSHAPGKKVDLTDTRLQELLRAKGETLLRAKEEMLTDGIFVSCVNYVEYRKNNLAVILPGHIAGYSIFGCRLLRQQEPETFDVILPEDYMCFSVNISVTVSYRLAYLAANKRGGQPVYAVQFEEVSDYEDGGIVYTFENFPFQFPVTKKMLNGKKLYINAGMGMPKFQTTVSGLNLKQI